MSVIGVAEVDPLGTLARTRIAAEFTATAAEAVRRDDEADGTAPSRLEAVVALPTERAAVAARPLIVAAGDVDVVPAAPAAELGASVSAWATAEPPVMAAPIPRATAPAPSQA
ncbi:MAG: hypothetical protein ACOYEV_16660 [Candidatus Nanopelagicales bacterium]